MTVGLPVYNGENYLSQAIDSILSQTFGDLRLIISDNASVDATEQICREAALSDPRIEYHRQTVNRGAAANYNFAVDLAGGEYFMWHAHDDLRAPEYLELAIEAFDRHPKASIVFSRSERIGPDGARGGELPRPDDLTSLFPHRRLRAAIACPHPDIVLFGLMRLDLLSETGRHGSFKGGDRLLVAEMSLRGEFVEISQPLFFNRDHPDRYVRMADNRANRSQKRAWWDTAATGTVSLPRWTGLKGYFTAVRHSPILDSRERVRSYASVAASLFGDRAYLLKQLVRDLGVASAEALRRLWRRVSKHGA